VTDETNNPVGIRQFAGWVRRRWNVAPREADLAVAAIGLAGETGEALEHIKKQIRARDPAAHKFNHEAFTLEMGDVLHYWCVLANHYGLDTQAIIDGNVKKLTEREAATVQPNYVPTARAMRESELRDREGYAAKSDPDLVGEMLERVRKTESI
jgi:NTP pyrophosphatase (non-canonical NTP hydrolase)